MHTIDVQLYSISERALTIAREAIDKVFGPNYAIKNPHLVAAMLPKILQELLAGAGDEN